MAYNDAPNIQGGILNFAELSDTVTSAAPPATLPVVPGLTPGGEWRVVGALSKLTVTNNVETVDVIGFNPLSPAVAQSLARLIKSTTKSWAATVVNTPAALLRAATGMANVEDPTTHKIALGESPVKFGWFCASIFKDGEHFLDIVFYGSFSISGDTTVIGTDPLAFELALNEVANEEAYAITVTPGDMIDA